MKKLFFLSAIAALSTIFFSCKKEAAKAENAVETGTVAELIKGKSINVAGFWFNYEMGMRFKSLAKGNIKSLKINLPVTGKKLITLWKASDRSVVYSHTIDCSVINSWDNNLDVDILIDPNTEYIISTNTLQYYSFATSVGLLPFLKGNIMLLGCSYKVGSAQVFPDVLNNTYIQGFVDFTFQKSM